MTDSTDPQQAFVYIIEPTDRNCYECYNHDLEEMMFYRNKADAQAELDRLNAEPLRVLNAQIADYQINLVIWQAFVQTNQPILATMNPRSRAGKLLAAQVAEAQVNINVGASIGRREHTGMFALREQLLR